MSSFQRKYFQHYLTCFCIFCTGTLRKRGHLHSEYLNDGDYCQNSFIRKSSSSYLIYVNISLIHRCKVYFCKDQKNTMSVWLIWVGIYQVTILKILISKIFLYFLKEKTILHRMCLIPMDHARGTDDLSGQKTDFSVFQKYPRCSLLLD
jgi:hypothetical protein